MNVPINVVANTAREELCDMPWAEYLSFPALNGSVLVEGRKSMLHLTHAWDVGRKDTDAFRLGRMIHCLLFEPGEFETRYWPWEGRRAGNEYKALCAEAAEAGAEVCKETGEYSIATAIEAAQGFLRCSRVQQLIKAGTAEQTVLAVEQGLQCKGRLDWVATGEHVLTDLKTANEILDAQFGRAFFNYGYDIKLALYERWLNRVTNDRWPVEVIVLENKPPYDCAVVPIPDAVLENGVDKALAIIQRVAQCIRSDTWPGVAYDEPYPLCVPHWEMIEETEEFQG